MSSYMNHSLLQTFYQYKYNISNGSKSYTFCDQNQNNLYVKKMPYNSYMRYSNDNPNIILNKYTNNLPLSRQLHISHIPNL